MDNPFNVILLIWTVLNFVLPWLPVPERFFRLSGGIYLFYILVVWPISLGVYA